MSAKAIFISYSHDWPEHSERVLQFSNALRSHGIEDLDEHRELPNAVRCLCSWPTFIFIAPDYQREALSLEQEF
jgi:hypothetical protein